MGMRNHEVYTYILIYQYYSGFQCNQQREFQGLKEGMLINQPEEYLSKNQQCTQIKNVLHYSLSLTIQDDGYKLKYQGYDMLAIYTLMKRGIITQVHGKVGVGKESDIYKCTLKSGRIGIIKLARLGRTSFKTIKRNRDYLKHRVSFNWLYLSRLASIREFTFMQMLHKIGLPTPVPIDCNRHCIVMSLIDGWPLSHVKKLAEPDIVFDQLVNLLESLLQVSYFVLVLLNKNGLIHSDFNEFNLMITEDNKITMIDFPQMVSRYHKNAKFYLERDIECVEVFFKRRYNFEATINLNLKNVSFTREFLINQVKCIQRLDQQLKASGFIHKELKKDIDHLNILVSVSLLPIISQEGYHEQYENSGNEDDDEDQQIDDESQEFEEISNEDIEQQSEDQEEYKQEEIITEKNENIIVKEYVEDIINAIETNKEYIKKERQTQNIFIDKNNSFDDFEQNEQVISEQMEEEEEGQNFIRLTRKQLASKKQYKKRVNKSKFLKNLQRKNHKRKFKLNKNNNKRRSKRVTNDDYFF